ncbi:MAG TPA: hypothetical protein VFM53_09225 [Anaeromyxobacteraceae bacterium]|nr:hypothetical protein [Anaeromyxobacteraceae bacterium]
MIRRAVPALLAALALSSASCAETVVADIPVVPPGPVPALAGTWTFEMDKANVTCTGEMTIDGTTGVGTYSGCGATGAPVASMVDSSQHFLILYQPPGLEPYWTRGMFVSPTQLEGAIYGHSWNGQQGFRATRN